MLEFFGFAPEFLVLMSYELVLMLELLVFVLVELFPIGLGKRTHRLLPPPVPLGFEGVSLQLDLLHFSTLKVELVRELAELFLVVANLIHVLCLFKLVLV